MIQRMPDESMHCVINILQNLEAMSVDKKVDKERAESAFQDILEMGKRLPKDFDTDKELQEARNFGFEDGKKTVLLYVVFCIKFKKIFKKFKKVSDI